MKKKIIEIRGERYYVEKHNDQWQLIHKKTKAYVTMTKYKKDIIPAATKIIMDLSDEKHKSMTEYAISSYKKRKRWCNPRFQALFKRVFDLDMRKFLDGKLSCLGIFSFKIAEFDHAIEWVEGTSTYQFIEKKYGPMAPRIIKKLIEG